MSNEYDQEVWGAREKYDIHTLPEASYSRVYVYKDHVRISIDDYQYVLKALEKLEKLKEKED